MSDLCTLTIEDGSLTLRMPDGTEVPGLVSVDVHQCLDELIKGERAEVNLELKVSTEAVGSDRETDREKFEACRRAVEALKELGEGITIEVNHRAKTSASEPVSFVYMGGREVGYVDDDGCFRVKKLDPKLFATLNSALDTIKEKGAP